MQEKNKLLQVGDRVQATQEIFEEDTEFAKIGDVGTVLDLTEEDFPVVQFDRTGHITSCFLIEIVVAQKN